MKLFTHQSKDFIKELLKEGFIENNGTLMRPDPDVKFCYDKLLAYARENVSKEFNKYPIWCWYKIDQASINNGIKIELEVPEELVLLTDYYDWGGGVLFYAESYFYAKNERDKQELLEIIERDFKNCLNKDMFREDIQAIIPYIKLEWVTNLDELKTQIK